MDENRMQTIKLLRLNPIPRGANFMCWDSFRMGPSYMYAHQLLYIVDGTGQNRMGPFSIAGLYFPSTHIMNCEKLSRFLES